MSFQSVSDQLAILQESNAQLKDLIECLGNLKFQPGSVPLDDDEDNIITELATEIQQTLRDQEEDFEGLQEDVYDLQVEGAGSESADHKRDLDVTVKRALKELKQYEKNYRRAYLSAKDALEAAQQQERELLLQSYVEPRTNSSSPVPSQYKRKQQAELSKEEREVNATSDVTMALRRTHEMMAAELSRSQFAQESLNESQTALRELSESYNTLDTLLSSSKNLLGTLLRSQKSDTWYLETAFYILAVTIGWLVFRRLFYGPLWWFLWFPMKIFIRSWINIFTAVRALGSSSVAVSSASPVLATQSVVHSSGTRNPVTMSGMRAPPSVNVGGGGRGAPMRPTGQPRSVSQGSEESISEQVGRIIDESATTEDVTEQTSEQTKLEESEEPEPAAEDQPNPMKRMWEEEKEASAEPAAEDKPNPMKRMWEEDERGAVKEERKKDEL